MKPNGRRLARWLVTPEILIEMGKHGCSPVDVVGNRLPDDAAYVGAVFDLNRLCVVLFLESESFEPVPEDGEIPLLPTTMFQQRRADPVSEPV